MSLTVNAKTFAPDAYSKDSVVYAGPANTVSVKDTIKLARTAPKPSSTFSGAARTQAKFVRTLTLTGALTPTSEGIIDTQCQVPVGFTAADVDSLVNDYAAYVGSAAFKTLLKNQLINY